MKWRDVNFYPLLPAGAIKCDWTDLSKGVYRYFIEHGFEYFIKNRPYELYVTDDAVYVDTEREGGSMEQRYCKFPILESL
jgi:hypothetical protein